MCSDDPPPGPSRRRGRAHLTYKFTRGLWRAADVNYFTGSHTTVDGQQNFDHGTVARNVNTQTVVRNITVHTRTLTVVLILVANIGAPSLASAQSPFRQLAVTFPVDRIDAVPGAATAPSVVPGTRVQTSPSADDMTISVYPVLVWVPSFTATTRVPAFPDTPGGPDLPGTSGSTSASFDGAALAGVSIEESKWRLDVDGIWAAVGSERETPRLAVDLDIIYGHASTGWKIYKDLSVTAGVRRVALKYDIQIEDRSNFVRKPGIWDPLVGLAWHSAPGSRFRLHVIGEGGGFGVGADVDLSGSVRTDIRLVPHFGLTLGYTVLYLKLSDTVLERTFEVKQTLHGPVAGLGFYF